MAEALILPALPESIELRSLRGGTVERAAASFSFFVRSVLGLRRFQSERLEALSVAAAAPTPVEARLLERWKALRTGGAVPELGWALPPAGEEAERG